MNACLYHISSCVSDMDACLCYSYACVFDGGLSVSNKDACQYHSYACLT